MAGSNLPKSVLKIQDIRLILVKCLCIFTLKTGVKVGRNREEEVDKRMNERERRRGMRRRRRRR